MCKPSGIKIKQKIIKAETCDDKGVTKKEKLILQLLLGLTCTENSWGIFTCIESLSRFCFKLTLSVETCGDGAQKKHISTLFRVVGHLPPPFLYTSRQMGRQTKTKSVFQFMTKHAKGGGGERIYCLALPESARIMRFLLRAPHPRAPGLSADHFNDASAVEHPRAHVCNISYSIRQCRTK